MSSGGERLRTLLPGVLIGGLSTLLTTGLILLVTRPPMGQAVRLEPPPSPAPIRVHVTGAVNQPGVYALPRDSILQDALKAAGGAAPNADLSRLNLALPLVDGVQVIAPIQPATDSPPAAHPPNSGPNANIPTPQPFPVSGGGLVNINTATLQELDTLPGIGPGLAQRIVDYRTEHGPFLRIEDLQKVPGIGPATFEKLRSLVTVQ